MTKNKDKKNNGDKDKNEHKFDRWWLTVPRPTHCPYCGAVMRDDQYGIGGYCLGGFNDTDTFGGCCDKCHKTVDVIMDPYNYDAETLDGFRQHKFMLDLIAHLNIPGETFDPPV